MDVLFPTPPRQLSNPSFSYATEICSPSFPLACRFPLVPPLLRRFAQWEARPPQRCLVARGVPALAPRPRPMGRRGAPPPSAPENAGAKPTPTSAFRTGALTKERGKTKERNRKSSFPVRGERSREAISATTNPSRTHRVMRHLTKKKKSLFWRTALFFLFISRLGEVNLKKKRTFQLLSFSLGFFFLLARSKK